MGLAVPCRAGEESLPPRVLTAEEIAGLAAAHDDPLPGLAVEAEGILRQFALPAKPDGVPQWMRSAPEGDPADTDYEAWGRVLVQNKESLRRGFYTGHQQMELPAGRALLRLAHPAAKTQADKVAALLEFTETESWDVWLAAAETLGHMKAAEYAPVIAKKTKTWPHEGVPQLMRVLEQLQGRECADLLASMLNGPVFNNGTYQEIMLILEGFGDPRCVDAAIAYLGHTGTRDRADALRVLRKYGHPALAPRFLRLLRLDDADARRQAGNDIARREELLWRHAGIRAKGIEALEALGCREAKPDIVSLLVTEQVEFVRLQAMKSLVALGSPEYAEQVRSLLGKDVLEWSRLQALSSLEEMDWKAVMPQLVPLLASDEPEKIRIETLKVISETGSRDSAARETLAILKESRTLGGILALLQDDRARIQAAALETLAGIHWDGPVEVILPSLRSRESEVQSAALKALKERPDPSVSAAIAAILPDSNWGVVSDALDSLVERKATEHAGAVFALLKPELQDWRSATVVDTLIALRAVDQKGHMVALLHDDDSRLRILGIRFLSQLDLHDTIPDVAARMLDGVESVRLAARRALWSAPEKLPFRLLPLYLEAAARFPGERAAILAEAYFHFGGVEQHRVALRWLGGRDDEFRPVISGDARNVRTIVDAVLTVCPAAEAEVYPRPVYESGALAGKLIAVTSWEPSDEVWLADVSADLSRRGFRESTAQVQVMAGDARARHPLRRALRAVMWTAIIQPLVWLLVMVVYPWSRLAQRAVWTGWVLRWLGFGWVGPVVLRIPWLRERMWRPFRESLVLPGEVVSFDEWTFFDAVRVTPAGGGEAQPALRVLEPVRGVTVLSGESGLGKTTLLQALASQAQRPVALLRAAECGAGLLEALRARLPRQARGDAAFLRALAVRGSPDILVDAVHEALPEVRAKLSAQVASLTGANILLTTQPVDWALPAGAVEWQLEPLRAQDIAPFLLKQGTAAVEAAGAGSPAERQGAFAARAAAFLDELEKLPPESAQAAALRRMLGNPMEAVLAAELLAAGLTPDPERLLEQRMEHLREDYAAEHGGDFPAGEFAQYLGKWRASGAPLLRLDVFAGVASFLARHRLLRKSADGDETWRFRHDKIMAWFLRPAS